MTRPLRAVIDLAALRHNYRQAAQCAPQAKLLAVLKANAYGHGAVACAHALADNAPAFGVACIEEALALRESGIRRPIALLEGLFDLEELLLIEREQLWPVLNQVWQVDAILNMRPQAPITVWLKLDSGMHRLGLSPEAFLVQWRRLAACPHVTGVHLVTHFATADGDTEHEQHYYHRQRQCAEHVASRLRQEGHVVPTCLANSPATLSGLAAGQWHRPGVMLYGVDPRIKQSPSHVLKPVMTLESRLIAIRDIAAGESVGYGGRYVAPHTMRIGVVACGYGDGYDRHAREGTPVLVDGELAQVVGRVSMDMLTVDLSQVPAPSLESRVVLWGDNLPIETVAAHCETISYTLMTGVAQRVPRIYIDAQDP